MKHRSLLMCLTLLGALSFTASLVFSVDRKVEQSPPRDDSSASGVFEMNAKALTSATAGVLVIAVGLCVGLRGSKNKLRVLIAIVFVVTLAAAAFGCSIFLLTLVQPWTGSAVVACLVGLGLFLLSSSMANGL